MMRIRLDGLDVEMYWVSRNPTRDAYVALRPIDLTHVPRIGEASTAKRRQEDRIHDRQRLSRRLQLAPGMVVVFQRKPWEVLEIREKPLDLWGEEWEKAFEEAVKRWESRLTPYGERPEKATWIDRPFNVVVRPHGKPQAKPRHLRAPASYTWKVLPEHYAVCRECGELPPCTSELQDRVIEERMAMAEELMSIPAGHCLGCGEAITSRMKSVRFPGPNLWRPDLGDDSAVFHARRECADDVDRYRKQWKAKGHAEPQAQLPLEKP